MPVLLQTFNRGHNFLRLWSLLTWGHDWQSQSKMQDLDCTYYVLRMKTSTRKKHGEQLWLESQGRYQRCNETSLFLDPGQMAERWNAQEFWGSNRMGWNLVHILGLPQHGWHFAQRAIVPEISFLHHFVLESGDPNLYAGPMAQRKDFKKIAQVLQSVRKEQGREKTFRGSKNKTKGWIRPSDLRKTAVSESKLVRSFSETSTASTPTWSYCDGRLHFAITVTWPDDVAYAIPFLVCVTGKTFCLDFPVIPCLMVLAQGSTWLKLNNSRFVLTQCCQ